jgi:hypothetical protein
MMSRFIFYTSLSTFRVTRMSVCLQSRIWDRYTAPSLLCWDAPEISRSDSLRALRIGRAGLRNHARICDTCSGVPGDQVFGERLTQLLTADLINDSVFFLVNVWGTLHCEHCPASIVVCDVEHTMSTSAYGAPNSLRWVYFSMFNKARFCGRLGVTWRWTEGYRLA